MRITTIAAAFAAAFAALFATAAVPAHADYISAADFKSPNRVEQGFAALNWTGAYVGGFAGYGSADWKDAGYTDPVSGWTFGVQAGADVQMGQLVAGVFADLASSSVTAKQSYTTTYYDKWYGNITTTSTSTTDVQGFGTAGVRIGLAVGDFLPYVKLGGAVGKFRNSGSYESPFGSSAWYATNLAIGYTLGGGLEYRFNRIASLFAEVRHTVFQPVTAYDTLFPVNEARFGANVRF